MREKIQRIPLGVMIVLFVLALAAIGLSAFKTMQKSNVSYTVPMDRQRYAEEMKKRAGNGGMRSSYQTSGQGSGGPRGRGGSGGNGQSSRGGYGGYSNYGPGGGR